MKLPSTLFIAAMALSAVFSACNKKYQKYDFHLLVVDKETQEPIPGVEISLKYAEPAVADSWLGQTDEEGLFKDKVKVRREEPDLLIFQSTADYLQASVPFKLNDKIEMQYLYRYKIALQNMNCFNETDSVFIQVPGGDYATFYGNHAGCEPKEFLVPQNNYSGKSTNPEIVVHVKVKRNGIVTEFEHVAGLQRNKTTAVEIEY